MYKIKKKLQKYFKKFFYKIFFLFYGKIEGKIIASENKKIKIERVFKETKFEYKIFLIQDGRLYTDRIQDTAIIMNNSIIEGPSHQLRPINNANVEENIIFEKGTPRLKKNLSGTVLSLLTGGGGNLNYSHWLFDVLPRLALCEKILSLTEIKYFLFPNLEKKFQKETILALGLNYKKCLSSKKFRHISSNKIIVTDHPYCLNNDATQDIMNIPLWISKWLINKFSKFQIKNQNLPSKIYIDRSDSETDTKNMRKILNETELLNLLEKNDFKKIKLSKISFEKQVQLFYNADIVAGLHGAGFSNIIFCKSNTKIVEFKNSDQVKQYENLAIKNQLNYKSIVCEPQNTLSNNQNAHISIPLDKIIKIINEK